MIIIEKLVIFLVAVILFIFIPLAIYKETEAIYKETEEWEAYKVEQNCKIVGKERGHKTTGVAPIIGGNGGVGVVITTTPDKTGWLCDDGVTYWR